MADNIIKQEPAGGTPAATENFSIQDTMDMGIGNRDLIKNLMAPETSTGSPDDIEPIVKKVEKQEPKKKEGAEAGKEIVNKKEGEELTGPEMISNFLGGDEEGAEGEKAEGAEGEGAEGAEGEGAEGEGAEGEGTEEDDRFKALATDLFSIGIFTKEEGEEEGAVDSPEALRDRFIAEKKKGAIGMVNEFIGQFGKDYQEAFDAIYVKGVDPKEYFGVYNTVVNFAELDLKSEENQVSVVRRALTDQGFEPEDVTSEVERLKSYGDLETVAGKHHKVLIKKETAKLQEMETAAEEALQNKTAIKNQYISNVQTILQDKLKEKTFDGIPINTKLANELQDFLLVDKYKMASGETLTDFDKVILEMKRPENHASKVKIALLLKIMEKDPSLATIQRAGITKKADALFANTAKQVEKAKTPVQRQKQKQVSWFK